MRAYGFALCAICPKEEGAWDASSDYGWREGDEAFFRHKK